MLWPGAKIYGQIAAWRMSRPATIHGLALWWRAELAPGVAELTARLDDVESRAVEALQLGDPLARSVGDRPQIDVGGTGRRRRLRLGLRRGRSDAGGERREDQQDAHAHFLRA